MVILFLDELTTVVPSEDAHQSEYVCAADKRREFISGRICGDNG